MPLEGVLERPCDILAPCALGAAIGAGTIPSLHCAIVCGAANNQLEDAAAGEALREAGILYAPDYVVNAGGIINIAEEFMGYDPARAERRVRGIYETTRDVLRRAEADGVSPARAADATGRGADGVAGRPSRPSTRTGRARPSTRLQTGCSAAAAERPAGLVIPIRDNIPTSRFAVVTVTLIAINVAVFLFQITRPNTTLPGYVSGHRGRWSAATPSRPSGASSPASSSTAARGPTRRCSRSRTASSTSSCACPSTRRG